ncbi:MAG: hypothetical protein C0392_03105 [Syntrophus sp. (in: bacteria)]|nr:hypothetical protein [Syntrophus sp. (in: bacteria)]
MSDTIKLLIDLLNRRFGDVPSMTEADWRQVIVEAQRHGVAPFLWYTLHNTSDCPQPPSGIQETLRANYYTAVVHFMRREHELKEVLQTLTSAGVSVVLLKGAAVAYSLYPNPVLRTMGDVDLWIPHTQIVPARQALHTIGYTIHSQEDHRPQALKDVLAGETQMMRNRPGAGLVELHWNVYPGEWLRHTARIDETKIWARSVPIEGMNMRRLSAEDLILHGSVHCAVNHQMSDGVVRTILDIVLAQRTWEIDWEVLVRRAREWRVATAVWLVLSLVSEFFSDPKVQLPLCSIAPSRFRQRVLGWFVPGIPSSGNPKLTAGPLRFIYQLWLVDRPVDVIRLLWRGIFPDRTWLILRYKLQDAPKWRIWLQWIWHPLRLVLRRDF